MSKTKHRVLLGMNVVDAALQRVRETFDAVDEVWVAFSGGKDSLVCLDLVRRVAKERGQKKINVFFRDEELIITDIVKFVEKFAEDTENFNFRWIAYKHNISKVILNKAEPFVAWDEKRAWHRQPPAYAEMDKDCSGLDEVGMDGKIFEDWGKQVAIVTGIRCDESIKRLQALRMASHKGWDCYMSNKTSKFTRMSRVIYDWSETDIFKYLYDQGIDYCPCYDLQIWKGAQLRVATVMHENAKSQFNVLKELDPQFYDQLRSVMPEIETKYLYERDVDLTKATLIDDRSFDGIRNYIREHVPQQSQDDFLGFIDRAERTRELNIEDDPKSAPYGRVSLFKVFRAVVRGTAPYDPVPISKVLNQAEIDYENGLDI